MFKPEELAALRKSSEALIALIDAASTDAAVHRGMGEVVRDMSPLVARYKQSKRSEQIIQAAWEGTE